MRKTFIAGNWKMNKDIAGTVDLINALTSQLTSEDTHRVVVVCPPFTSLVTASSLLKGSSIKLGAQNMSEHDEGAYTGEVSSGMLKSVGCEYVIVGHSERRLYFGESNQLINLKAKKGIAGGLRPIICIGETLSEREKGITDQVVMTQIAGVLDGLSGRDMDRVVIAYEPVWAIGTGRNATPDQAEEVHRLIRKLITQKFDHSVAENTLILYGGSVKPDNAADLLAQDDIDGALVGGACLKAESFLGIIRAAKR
jgi:triosephosphate isomerase